MRVLVACEFSGVVRDAFLEQGFEALSCDVLESERPGPHYVGDVREVLEDGWDAMIAHPPCTALTRAADWKYRDSQARSDALAFVLQLWEAPIPHVAIENPRGLNRHWRQPDQTIQPWYFGHEERKTTMLWLRALPPLLPTALMERTDRNTINGQNKLGPSLHRWRDRSRTYAGVAAAMAEQWGDFLLREHRRQYHDPRDLAAEPCCFACCDCSEADI